MAGAPDIVCHPFLLALQGSCSRDVSDGPAWEPETWSLVAPGSSATTAASPLHGYATPGSSDDSTCPSPPGLRAQQVARKGHSLRPPALDQAVHSTALGKNHTMPPASRQQRTIFVLDEEEDICFQIPTVCIISHLFSSNLGSLKIVSHISGR